MTDAPERIWLTSFTKDQYGARLGRGTVSDLDHNPNPDYPEYSRADIHAEVIEAAEQRGYARALEAAATEMDTAAHIMSHHGSVTEVKCYQNAAKAIRALEEQEGD